MGFFSLFDVFRLIIYFVDLYVLIGQLLKGVKIDTRTLIRKT